jgi:hypothetical protein
MSVHLFGIRHHGPGSARSLQQALNALKPDALLIEGPPDAESLLPWVLHADLRPPVALLIYVPDDPNRGVYYPFAEFSPEWQAFRYGLKNRIPVHFMDLPQAHQLAIPSEVDERDSAGTQGDIQEDIREDPFAWVAQATGYSDSERWWEQMIEQRRDSVELFTAIQELMTALREEFAIETDPLDAQREATMRQAIRQAKRDGYQRIAVVCGAWHVPALAQMPPAKVDIQTLHGLPKTKVAATWVPWTYGRLAQRSGYGAGIESPGWYDHLWANPENITVRWLTNVAQLLRSEDLDASPSHIIEAVRLAESLAALRDRPIPGLPELLEAVQAVFCFGNPTPLQLIREKLLMSDRMGQVPAGTPMLPLQQDLQRQQKRLRLMPKPGPRPLKLDLRKPMHLGRSHLLHRLNLLGIPWGHTERVQGKRGTFHEVWQLEWQPEFAIAVIEANVWGNTILDAATHYALHRAEQVPDLPTLTELAQDVLLADLREAVRHLMIRLENATALSHDIGHLMAALPPLATVLRYGNVRQTDAASVEQVVNSLVVRICVSLPNACASLDEEAAQTMFKQVVQVNQAITLLQNQQHQSLWFETLEKLAGQRNLHGLLAGRCCRLLHEQNIWPAADIERRMNFACSPTNPPLDTAYWLEGFLQGSGLLLLHNDSLWQSLDTWLTGLPAETFTQLLPLLRRTFATFPAPERRQMGERVRRGETVMSATFRGDEVDVERARQVLSIAAKLLGIE